LVILKNRPQKRANEAPPKVGQQIQSFLRATVKFGLDFRIKVITEGLSGVSSTSLAGLLVKVDNQIIKIVVQFSERHDSGILLGSCRLLLAGDVNCHTNP